MTLSLRTAPRRHLAAAMLFVWLLALAAGIVNACALGEGREVLDAVAGATQHGHGAPASHDHEEPCQKLCDDEGVALNRVVKELGGSSALAPMLLQTTTLAWVSGGVAEQGAPRPRVTVGDNGPPIAIRYLRLTL